MIDLKLFDEWNIVKKRLDRKEVQHFFKEGQIWWCSIGQNIGSESYGKGIQFLRPALILKKLSASIFIGIPLTTKNKTGSWFVSFNHRNRNITALLHQIRLFDTRRMLDHAGQIDNTDFSKIKQALKSLLNI